MKRIVLLLLVACARPPAPAPLPGNSAVLGAEPHYLAGEQITWEVSVLGIRGGRARMATGEVGVEGGQRVVAAVIEVESAGVLATIKRGRESVASWIDVASGLPARTETEQEGSELVVVQTKRTAGEARLRISRGGADEDRVQPVPEATHDAVSAILALRGWRAPVGSRARYHLLDGARLWRNDVLVAARETVEVPLGKRTAIKITGTSHALTPALAEDPATRPRVFAYWISDDDERVPLRLTSTTAYGEIEMRASSHALR